MSTSILIVEDETRLAEILEDYLRREGYKTERAKDGGRALELWRVAQPDLILLDLMLPVLDGARGGPAHPRRIGRTDYHAHGPR